jgi:hypothetical protein
VKAAKRRHRQLRALRRHTRTVAWMRSTPRGWAGLGAGAAWWQTLPAASLLRSWQRITGHLGIRQRQQSESGLVVVRRK